MQRGGEGSTLGLSVDGGHGASVEQTLSTRVDSDPRMTAGQTLRLRGGCGHSDC